MTFRAILALILACAVMPAMAETAKPAKPAKPAASHPAADPVVARVNGIELHRSDVIEVMHSLPPQTQQQPMEKLYPAVLDQLVRTVVVSQAAHRQKLQDDPEVKKRLALITDQVLADAYVQHLLQKDITEPKLKARYDKYIKDAPPREEIDARHILLANEADAKEVITELKKGADFAKLAEEKTTDPAGKSSGGELGYFTRDEMVPEFADAAFKLKKGEFTETPVKTQFGWHVIKLEDRRTAKPLSFEQMKPQLANQMSREIVGEKVKELSASAKIEVFNMDGSKPSAAPPPASANVPKLAPETAPPTLAPETKPADAPPTLSPATKP